MLKKSKIDPDNMKAIGPYSLGLKVGNTVHVSGQLPIDLHSNEIEHDDIKKQAVIVFENLETILSEVGLSLQNVVKTTIFLQDLDDFNVVNQVYALYFSPPYPARSTIEVRRLPKDAFIMVECVAYDTRESDYKEAILNDDCGGEGCQD